MPPQVLEDLVDALNVGIAISQEFESGDRTAKCLSRRSRRQLGGVAEAAARPVHVSVNQLQHPQVVPGPLIRLTGLRPELRLGKRKYLGEVFGDPGPHRQGCCAPPAKR